MQGVQLRSKTNRGKRNIVSNLKKRAFKKKPSSECMVVYQLESRKL